MTLFQKKKISSLHFLKMWPLYAPSSPHQLRFVSISCSSVTDVSTGVSLNAKVLRALSCSLLNHFDCTGKLLCVCMWEVFEGTVECGSSFLGVWACFCVCVYHRLTRHILLDVVSGQSHRGPFVHVRLQSLSGKQFEKTFSSWGHKVKNLGFFFVF